MVSKMPENKKIAIKTKGMHCVSCEHIIKEAILNIDGVKNAKVNYVTEKATVEFNPAKTNINNIMKAIKNVGYEPEKIDQEKESKGFFKKLFG